MTSQDTQEGCCEVCEPQIAHNNSCPCHTIIMDEAGPVPDRVWDTQESMKESGGWEDKYWFLARGLSTAEKNAILELIRELLISERARIVTLLDWRNREDGVVFNGGGDVIDWIDAKLKTLSD